MNERILGKEAAIFGKEFLNSFIEQRDSLDLTKKKIHEKLASLEYDLKQKKDELVILLIPPVAEVYPLRRLEESTGCKGLLANHQDSFERKQFLIAELKKIKSNGGGEEGFLHKGQFLRKAQQELKLEKYSLSLSLEKYKDPSFSKLYLEKDVSRYQNWWNWFFRKEIFQIVNKKKVLKKFGASNSKELVQTSESFWKDTQGKISANRLNMESLERDRQKLEEKIMNYRALKRELKKLCKFPLRSLRKILNSYFENFDSWKNLLPQKGPGIKEKIFEIMVLVEKARYLKAVEKVIEHQQERFILPRKYLEKSIKFFEENPEGILNSNASERLMEFQGKVKLQIIKKIKNLEGRVKKVLKYEQMLVTEEEDSWLEEFDLPFLLYEVFWKDFPKRRPSEVEEILMEEIWFIPFSTKELILHDKLTKEYFFAESK